MKTILLAFLLISVTSQAAENLQFSGTLVAPPICTVNNEETIEIDFGNVAIDRINGSNYTELVGLFIYCDSVRQDNSIAMTLSFGGTPTDFDPAAIETDVEGLGIEIRQNDKPLNIGDVLVVNELAIPMLEAVPVKKNGASLPIGDFEAWGTIKVEYQ